ncbi:hybrid sensor histidine kinase/response regulator transcription factor [Bacteroides sp.]
MCYFYKYLLFSILFLPTLLTAGNRIQFKSVIPSTNFPTNEVRSLYQDSEGYIWISTYNGLVRYDGYSIVVYKPNGINHGHSIDGFVNLVSEDKQGHLWIGTHNGLYVLNKQTDEIEKQTNPLLQECNVEAIVCTKTGELWIGGSKGLFRCKSGSLFFECVMQVDVKSILEDHCGHIWVGTWDKGLLRYSPGEDRFYTYMGIAPNNSSHVLFEDDANNIWVGSWRYGLKKLINPYDMEDFSFRTFSHRENDSTSLLDNIIYAIIQDRKTKKIWIGSRSGLSILESEINGGTFTNFVPGDHQYDLPFNEVNTLLCSNDGLMWVGMLGGGVCTVNTGKVWFNYHSLSNLRKYCPTGSVRSVFQDDNGLLWMGIMGFGLISYDRSTGKIIPYKEHPALKDLRYTSTVNEIIRSKRTGELCFATWDAGVWLYNEETGKVRVIDERNYPAIRDVCIYSLLEDSHGNLWLGTRAGVSILDHSGRMLSLNEMLVSSGQTLPQISAFKIVEDKNGFIWIATSNQGIWRVNESGYGKYSVKKYTPSEGTLSLMGTMTVCVDGYNRVWVGTNGGGLSLYNREKDAFIPMFTEYFMKGDVVFNIQEDDGHTLWLTTNSEMYHIELPPNGDVGRVHTYTVDDGLQDRIFNRNSCCKGKNNELFFGGYRGLNSFFPDKIEWDTTSSPIVITDIKIQNKSFRDLSLEKRKEMAGTGAIQYAHKIVLSHWDNNFSIDFSILNYINPQLNRYQYMLQGYDPEWISVGVGHRFAYYNNLPSGTYTFYVKGANQNGVWSPKTQCIQVKILPPLWLSWWAYCVYVLVIVALGWYTYRIVRNRMRMKQIIELGKIERQKIEEINHAKLQFFTNITHELLTPLTIISASVDELKREMPAGFQVIDVMNNNTQRLIRLIQQILEFRKVENGKLQLRVSYGDITSFLERAISAFMPLVRKKKLFVCFDYAEKISGYFDMDKLDKVVYNLLSNAAKYTSEGGQITVRQEYDSESCLFTISINNPGEVIPEDKLEHLFDRFYEGEYRKFHTIGTGIGMSLTKDLVLLHHGTIKVLSTKESGNTFVVEIPIERSAFNSIEIDDNIRGLGNDLNTVSVEDELEIAETSIEEEGDIEASVILLVEDNDELLTAIERLLQGKYHILEARNGLEALQILSEQEVDLIVSDVMMPEMDGIELCRRVKNTFETCHIPLILLTARTSEDDQITGYESGADGYICKPLQISVLFARIDNLLRKKKRANVDFRKQLVFEAKELDYTSMDELFIQKAVSCVNAHLSDCDFEHAQLLAEMGMARTTFADKLKFLTGFTPSAFICNVRLQAACRLIDEKKKIRVSDLAFAVGFNDPKYFSACFKKKFGLSPTEYMAKYNG